MEEEGLSEARKVVMAASLADISIRVCSFSQTCYGHSWVKTCFRRSGAADREAQQGAFQSISERTRLDSPPPKTPLAPNIQTS